MAFFNFKAKEIILFYLIITLLLICIFFLFRDRFNEIRKPEQQFIDDKALDLDNMEKNIKKNLYLSKMYNIFICVLMVVTAWIMFIFFAFEFYLKGKENKN